MNVVQKIAMMYIVTQLLPKKERNGDIFLYLDKDGDGRLSKNDLLEEYKNIFPVKKTQEIVDKILEIYDIDHSGYINFSGNVIYSNRVFNRNN